MQVLQHARELDAEHDRLGLAEATPRAHELEQARPSDVLLDQAHARVLAVFLAEEVDEPRDARVVEPLQHARLAHQQLVGLQCIGRREREHLHHAALARLVVEREVGRRGDTPAEHGLELVPAFEPPLAHGRAPPSPLGGGSIALLDARGGDALEPRRGLRIAHVAPHLLLALALSTLIGLSLGLLGGGGSILAVPVLVYVARVDVHAAIGMSLAIVGGTALVGGLVHARAGRVDLRAGALFGVAGMIAAPFGARATHLVAPRLLLVLFAALMLGVGTLMLRGSGEIRTSRRPHRLAVPLAGLLVGLLTGFLGVGGGFLIVPALTLLAGLEVPAAVGTSLFVIAANSAAGLVSHLGQGEMPAGLTAAFTLAAVVGALAGVRLSSRLHPTRLRRGFALFVILVGLALLARNALAP